MAINGYSLKLVTIAACCNGVCGLQHSGLGRPVGFGEPSANRVVKADKTLAGLKARGVANVNQVNNELEVAAKP